MGKTWICSINVFVFNIFYKNIGSRIGKGKSTQNRMTPNRIGDKKSHQDIPTIVFSTNKL